jgi:hypothetical protein
MALGQYQTNESGATLAKTLAWLFRAWISGHGSAGICTHGGLLFETDAQMAKIFDTIKAVLSHVFCGALSAFECCSPLRPQITEVSTKPTHKCGQHFISTGQVGLIPGHRHTRMADRLCLEPVRNVH